MSIGQIAEIFTMAWLGFFLKRLGWRRTMIIGILGHVVRFAIYSLGYYYQGTMWLWLVILSNIVHGFAYAFFFATVYIFVDETFPKDIRTSAQSLFNLLILGLGPSSGGFSGIGWETYSRPREGRSSSVGCSSFRLHSACWLRSFSLSLSIPKKSSNRFPKRSPSLSAKRASARSLASLVCGCF